MRRMQKWLARLSFSFMILAAVLAWEAWKLSNSVGVDRQPRMTLYVLGAALLFGLGLAGVKARHRPME